MHDRSFKTHWDRWYGRLLQPAGMGAKTTYKRAIEFLDIGGTLEDWGGGTGYARQFVKKSDYILIDGSWSKFDDKVVELEEYTSDADCILMRHVLEHNYGWEQILRNAVNSFQKKMALVIFTPLAEETCIISDAASRFPTHSFKCSDLTDLMSGIVPIIQPVFKEHIFYLEK